MALPPKLLKQGRHRYGAHLRRAHERHGVRHGGAARVAGGRGGRSARAGARTATRSNWMSRRGGCTSMCREDELARRRAQWTAPAAGSDRGYVRLYVEHVMQADQGADLDFLVGASGAPVPRESH